MKEPPDLLPGQSVFNAPFFPRARAWWQGIGLALAVLAAILGYFLWGVSRSLQAKNEQTLLWSAEREYLGKPISHTEFHFQGGRNLACVRGATGKRVWIMLDPQYPPYYLQRPERGQFDLDPTEFEPILREKRVHPTVRRCLESHMHNGDD